MIVILFMKNSVIFLFLVVVLSSGCVSQNDSISSYEDGSFVLTEEMIYQTSFYDESGLNRENLYMVDEQSGSSLDSEAVEVQEGNAFTANLLIHSGDTFEDMPNAVISSQFKIDEEQDLEPLVEDYANELRDRDIREVRNLDASGDRIVLEESEAYDGEVDRYVVSVFNREGEVGYELTMIDFEEEPLEAWKELADMKDKGMKEYLENN